MRMAPDLVELESWNVGYYGNGSLSTIVWPNGSVSAVPQAAFELIVALTLTRLAMA